MLAGARKEPDMEVRMLEERVRELENVLNEMDWELETASGADCYDLIPESFHRERDMVSDEFVDAMNRLYRFWKESPGSVSEEFGDGFRQAEAEEAALAAEGYGFDENGVLQYYG